MDQRPPLDPAFAAFGLDVTIPFAPDAGVTTTVRGIPLPYRPADVPLGTDLRDQAHRVVFAFRRAEVGTLPRGTLVEAPEIQGGPVVSWKVESLDYCGPDELRVVCVRA